MISANNGILTLDNLTTTDVFLGSSGSGQFPPANSQYHRFSGKPSSGENGILVFGSRVPILKDQLQFYQYVWHPDGKLRIESGIKHSDRVYSIRNDTGFLVPCRKWYYVTKVPANAEEDYRLVDLFVMLRFIEGKIGFRELDRNARSVKRRPIHERRMSELQQSIRVLAKFHFNAEISLLEAHHENADLRRQLQDTEQRLADARQAHENLLDAIEWAVKLFRKLPFFVIPETIEHLMRLYDEARGEEK